MKVFTIIGTLDYFFFDFQHASYTQTSVNF